MEQTLHQPETLIVGSGGFIGRNLQALLSDLDMSFVRGMRASEGKNIGFQLPRGEESFTEYPEIKRIIHVGTPSIEPDCDSKSIMNMHVEEVLQFAGVASNLNRKIYFYWAGSYWQDQERFDYYTNAKRRIEEGLQAISSENFRVASLHLGDSYGLQDTRKKLIPAILESLLNRSILHIENSRNLMTPIHISDIKTAFTTLFSLEESNSSSVFQIFELIGMEVVSVQKILDTVKTLNGEFQYQNHRQKSHVFNIQPAHASISGWFPRIDLSEGLKEILSGSEVSKF